MKCNEVHSLFAKYHQKTVLIVRQILSLWNIHQKFQEFRPQFGLQVNHCTVRSIPFPKFWLLTYAKTLSPFHPDKYILISFKRNSLKFVSASGRYANLSTCTLTTHVSVASECQISHSTIPINLLSLTGPSSVLIFNLENRVTVILNFLKHRD